MAGLMFGGAFAGGGSGGGQNVNKLKAIQSLSGGYGNPITIAYGLNKVSMTLGWYNGFRAIKQDSGGGKGGGKGAGGSYKYYANVLFFVCEGPILSFGKFWRDKDKSATTTPKVLSKGSDGDYDVVPWDFIVTKYPAEALAYRGTAYLASSGYPLRDGAVLGNHSVEVRGRMITNSPGTQNEKDAFIKDVILDFVENPHYGVVDANTYQFSYDFSALHDYTRARGLLISPVLASRKPANEWLKEWLMVANAACIFSEGVLKFPPYADLSYSNSFATYTPDTAIRYHFDDDNIDQLLKPERKNPADCYNKIQVDCLSRVRDYNKHPIEVKDEADIRLNGLRTAEKLTFESICLPSIAMVVAHTELSKGLNIRNTYTISTSWDADLLEPLDFITITDAALGLNNTRCRIVSIEDDEVTESGGATIRIRAEEAPIGVYCG